MPEKNSPPNIGEGDDLLTEDPKDGFEGEDLDDPEVNQDPDDDAEEDESPDKGQEEADPELTPKVQEFLKKKGLKNLEAFVDSYENLQTQSTELGKKARLQGLTSNLQQIIPPYQKPVEKEIEIDIPDDPQDLLVDKDKFKKYITSLVQSSRDAGREGAIEEANEREYKVAAQKLVTKVAEDPEGFERLRPIMYRISLNQPNLSFDDLWSQAGDVDKKDRKAQAAVMVKELFGEDIDPSAVKTLLSKSRPASLSTGSGVGGGGGDLSKSQKSRKIEDDLKKRILAAGVLNG